MYYSLTTISFNDVKDIEDTINGWLPNMFMIHDMKNSNEIQIYRWDFQGYTFKNNDLTIKLKNKTLNFQVA